LRECEQCIVVMQVKVDVSVASQHYQADCRADGLLGRRWVIQAEAGGMLGSFKIGAALPTETESWSKGWANRAR